LENRQQSGLKHGPTLFGYATSACARTLGIDEGDVRVLFGVAVLQLHHACSLHITETTNHSAPENTALVLVDYQAGTLQPIKNRTNGFPPTRDCDDYDNQPS
jgi:hypothetical protein